VVCYAQAVHVFALLPIVGKWLYFAGTLGLAILGLAIAHRIPPGKSALAVLLPNLLCCACFAVLTFTLLATFIRRMGWF